jgi:hypothetical protein
VRATSTCCYAMQEYRSQASPDGRFPLHERNDAKTGADLWALPAPDGPFLLNTVVDKASAAPITLVLNWKAALKK